MQGVYRKVLGYDIPRTRWRRWRVLFCQAFAYADQHKGKQRIKAQSEQIQETQDHHSNGPMQSALDSYRPEYSLALSQVFHGLAPGGCIRCKKNPKDARYIGKHGCTYVWCCDD